MRSIAAISPTDSRRGSLQTVRTTRRGARRRASLRSSGLSRFAGSFGCGANAGMRSFCVAIESFGGRVAEKRGEPLARARNRSDRVPSESSPSLSRNLWQSMHANSSTMALRPASTRLFKSATWPVALPPSAARANATSSIACLYFASSSPFNSFKLVADRVLHESDHVAIFELRVAEVMWARQFFRDREFRASNRSCRSPTSSRRSASRQRSPANIIRRASVVRRVAVASCTMLAKELRALRLGIASQKRQVRRSAECQSASSPTRPRARLALPHRRRRPDSVAIRVSCRCGRRAMRARSVRRRRPTTRTSTRR